MKQEDLPFELRVFERRVNFTRAKNWLKSDAKRNYGHIGMKINFALIGPKGAITWTVHTDWFVKSSRDTWRENEYASQIDRAPEAWDLGYHAYEAQYEGQSSNECHLLKGCRCYYDGTSLGARELVEPFLAGGDEWLWSFLEAYYAAIFEGGEYPSTTPVYEPHPDDKN